MKNINKYISVFLSLAFTSIVFGQQSSLSELISLHEEELKPIKEEIQASIETQEKNLIKISDAIWEAAETSLEEHISSKLLKDYARANGFEVTENVADIPTAFMAKYGSGKPVI